MAVVDSSALIPLSRVGSIGLLRELFGTCHAPEAVHRECVVEGRGRPGARAIEEAFGDWIPVREADARATRALAEAEDIEPTDAATVLLARELRAPLVTNDAHLVAVARARGVQAKWVTTCILEARNRGLRDAEGAKRLLLDLVEAGMLLRPDVLVAVLREIERS